MPINRKHFEDGFFRLPAWSCPSCRNGTYSNVKESIQIRETGPSKSAHAHEAWDPDWIEESFVQMMECNSCGEVAAVAGRASNFLHQYYGCDGEIEMDLQKTLHPCSVIPAPLVFDIPKNAPENLSRELLKAFALLWMDHEACATRIRTCIELFLDDLKIPSTRKNKKGREFEISLHDRIAEYGNIDKDSSEFLLAVKWIGNAGSHANTSSLTRNDLLDVLEILDFVLEETYVGRKKKLSGIAGAINAAKGKPE